MNTNFTNALWELTRTAIKLPPRYGWVGTGNAYALHAPDFIEPYNRGRTKALLGIYVYHDEVSMSIYIGELVETAGFRNHSWDFRDPNFPDPVVDLVKKLLPAYRRLMKPFLLATAELKLTI